MTYRELIAQIRDFGFSDDTEIEDFDELVPNDINQSITEINIEVDPIIGSFDFEVKDDDTGYLYIDMAQVFSETITGDGETVSFELDQTPRRILSVTYVDDDEETTITGYSLSENVITFTDVPPFGRVMTVNYAIYGDPNFLEFDKTPIQIKESGENGRELYETFNDYFIENDRVMILDADKNKGSFRVFYKRLHDKFRGDEDEMETQLPLNPRVHYLVPLLTAYYVWLDDEPVKAAQYYNLYEQKKRDFLDGTINKPRMRVLQGGI